MAPIAIGFGINTLEKSKNMIKIANGIIVDSVIVKIIEKHGDNLSQYIKEYISEMKNAIQN